MRQSRANLYRKVTLYDPAIKRGRVVEVLKSDFDTPEALEAYVQKLKEENRARNAELRKQRRVKKYDAVLEPVPMEADSPLPVDAPLTPAPALTPFPKITIDPKTGSTFVIFGSSKRGKSTLMMRLYKDYFSDSKYISTLFSGNPQLKLYRARGLDVVYGFTRAHANGIKAQQYIQVKTKNRYRFFNCFDDIIDQKRAPIIADMMLTYRNSNISMCIALQYSFLLAKENRSNVNHTFIFGMNTAEDIENIINVYLRPWFLGQGINSLQAQIAAFKEITGDHGYIYVNNLTGDISVHRLK